MTLKKKKATTKKPKKTQKKKKGSSIQKKTQKKTSRKSQKISGRPRRTTRVKVTAGKKSSIATTESSRKEAIKAIKAELLKQKQVLLGEAGATLNNMPPAILYPDMGDQAGMEIERNFLLRLRGREQKLLKKIDDALERIDNGTFGLCEICGREIDIKRLMARPVTTMCIECKMEQEEEEKLREI